MYSGIMKKLIRRSYHLIGMLPERFRGPLIRNQLNLKYDYIPGVKIKVAETKEEIEAAYQILHDTYSDVSLIEKEESGLRVTKYHALPSTTLCIVKQFDEVVGTFTIIKDNSLGLPIDETSDIENLRKRNSRVAEISALAIKKECGLRRGALMFPVINFIYLFSEEIGGIDALVAVVNNTAQYFYKDILGFSSLDLKEDIDYNYVNAKHIYPVFVEFNFRSINSLKNRLKQVYGNSRPSRNMHHYLFVHRDKHHIEFPKQEYSVCSYNKIDPLMIKEFFVDRTQTLKSLNQEEKTRLKHIYTHPELLKNISPLRGKDLGSRTNIRFPVSLRSELTYNELSSRTKAKVLEASSSGLSIFSKEGFIEGQRVQLRVELGNGKTVNLRGKICWTNSEYNRYGVSFTKLPNKDWMNYQSYLRENYYPSLRSNKIDSNTDKSSIAS